jgi:hypothetical protein
VRRKLSSEEIQIKIVASSIPDEITGCWNWNKGKFVTGYGSLFNGVNNVAAYKASFEAFIGEIPKCSSILILHKCNNEGCVNPQHLYIGTKKDNTYDALMSGAFIGRRILTGEERLQIKQLYLEGKSMRSIAKTYNTNHPQISRAIKENSYAFS